MTGQSKVKTEGVTGVPLKKVKGEWEERTRTAKKRPAKKKPMKPPKSALETGTRAVTGGEKKSHDADRGVTGSVKSQNVR